MNPGYIILVLTFLTSLAAGIFYLIAAKQQKPVLSLLATRLYDVAVLGGILASMALLYYLFTHQFQYTYVADYSSKTQPVIYLISAFWAGQEGTFLLWALLTGVLGLVLRKTTKASDPIAMAVVTFFAAFLYLLLMVKNPFGLVDHPVQDGRGMNPLLMNIWMSIHPPILFVGYAVTLFPFALAVSSLARREYTLWHEQGFAWTLFASVMLGAGIIIGGFWAYETLGWGGYWGWDPVENSSLVPWLTLLALVHGLLVFKTKGGLARTNLFLAIITFLLVLYATFLTRSGVLADFSVHSFVDLGINNYLVGIIVLTALVGFGLFVTRFSSIKTAKMGITSLNREITLVLSLFVLLAAAAFTFAGMSSPIITKLFGNASQVDTSFYNKVNFPIAVVMSLLLGITPFLGWTEENKLSLLKRYSLPLIVTALACVIAYVAGVDTVSTMLFIGAAIFALSSNTIIAVRSYRSGWLTLGGPITHIGTALLLVGIIGSGRFDETKQVMIVQGGSQTLFGYTIHYKDFVEGPDQKTVVNLEIQDGKNTFKSGPKLYFSQYSQSVMREPDIKIFPLKDLYLSPLDLKPSVLEIKKGETKIYQGYTFQFVGFETGSHGMMASMSVGALVNVTANGVTSEVRPSIMLGQAGQQYVPAELPFLEKAATGEKNPVLILSGMSVEEQKITLELRRNGGNDIGSFDLLLEVSVKPLMMVVWTGVVLILAGTAIALIRRSKKTPPVQS